VFREGAEVVVFNDDGSRFQWSGFRKRKRLPKRVISTGTPDAIYEYHYRCVGADIRPHYQKRLILFDAKGRQMIAWIQGHIVSPDRQASPWPILMASIIEDANRTGTVLASVTDSLEIKFPIPLDAYKELFIVRDAPLTPAGRKKAILHWVSKHLRNTPSKTVAVAGHTRGVDVFDIGGFRISLKHNNI
jgi:hypothetical protein